MNFFAITLGSVYLIVWVTNIISRRAQDFDELSRVAPVFAADLAAAVPPKENRLINKRYLACICLVSAIGCSSSVTGPDAAQQGKRLQSKKSVTSLPPFEPETIIAKSYPVIKNVPIEPATTDKIFENDLVLGVTIDGHSRAYPISGLSGPTREIINDHLGDKSIAATW